MASSSSCQPGEDVLAIRLSAKRPSRGSALNSPRRWESRRSRRSPKISCSHFLASSPGSISLRISQSRIPSSVVDDMEVGDMLTKIREVYGLDVADMPNGNRLEDLQTAARTPGWRSQRRTGSPYCIAYEIEGPMTTPSGRPWDVSCPATTGGRWSERPLGWTLESD